MKQLSHFSPEQVQDARNKVSKDWAELHKRIKEDDHYASHVTKEQKEENLNRALQYAAEIKKGKHDGNFTIWQRLMIELTGECIAFLPK